MSLTSRAIAARATAAPRSTAALASRARPTGSAPALHRLQREAGNAVAVRTLALSTRHTVRPRSIATSGMRVARQDLAPITPEPEIPNDLKRSLAVNLMSDEELRRQYDRVVKLRAACEARHPTESVPETAALDEHIEAISAEISRRQALSAGRTFSQKAIDEMKAYLIANATKTKPDSCIVCMNNSIRKVLQDPNQPLTPKSVEKTMEMMQKSGRASDARLIKFKNARGKITSGAAEPASLDESVYDAVIAMLAGDAGWSVFGMSLMDGEHSVLLTVDNSDRRNPKVYWNDQWSSKGGWKEYSRSGLDEEIVRLVQGWWKKQAEGKKHTTIVRLWRLRQNAPAP